MEHEGKGPTGCLNEFGDPGPLSALVHGVHALDSEDIAIGGDSIAVSASVHGPLERVALPCKEVVGVLSVPGTMHSNNSERHSFSTKRRIY
jgi:hypothetical protein